MAKLENLIYKEGVVCGLKNNAPYHRHPCSDNKSLYHCFDTRVCSYRKKIDNKSYCNYVPKK